MTTFVRSSHVISNDKSFDFSTYVKLTGPELRGVDRSILRLFHFKLGQHHQGCVIADDISISININIKNININININTTREVSLLIA